MKYMRQLVLIDGKWLGYKMHFSHLGLKSNGKATGMLHGFLSELLRINRKLPEAKIFVCWDGKKKTWRHSLYPKYKANRQFNPQYQEMQEQTEKLLDVLRKLGMWVLRVDDVEADDMIGMLASKFSDSGYEVRIHSKDRDMFQLVSDYVWVWPDLKLAPIRKTDIEKWLGAPFEALLDIRAMAGDSGDNLKGLPGVGYKTAVELWNRGLRLEGGLSNGKLFEKYKEHWRRVKEERELAKIVTTPASPVWSKGTRRELTKLLKDVFARPGRDIDAAEANRREVYRFLGEHELKELLAERHKLFLLP